MAASSYGGFEDLELLMDRNLHQTLANSRPQRPIPMGVEQSARGEQEQEEFSGMMMIPGSQGVEIDMDLGLFCSGCFVLVWFGLVWFWWGKGQLVQRHSLCCGFLFVNQDLSHLG